MIGALIALSSAFCFALSDVFVRRGVAKASVAYGAFITVLLGVPLFTIGALLFGQLFRVDQISGEGYVYLAAAGIIHPYLKLRANWPSDSNCSRPTTCKQYEGSLLYPVRHRWDHGVPRVDRPPYFRSFCPTAASREATFSWKP